MRLIFLGPPGAGKGTQAEFICRDFSIVQLSTGDLLRNSIKIGSELGKAADSFMKSGELVPDDIMIDIIKESLIKPELANGYLLDGFPRTAPQAKELDKLLIEMNQKLDAVLALQVNNEELVQRLTSRRTCKVCGKSYHLEFNPPKIEGLCDLDGSELFHRDDDKEGPIRIRLKVYEIQTFPLINYYEKQGLIKFIDGKGNIKEIYSNIFSILNNLK